VSRVVDSEQRIRAIDPQGSFCVTAPAGSGKTELLIQRYLALLPRVSQPEQILAITFTRKAAAEMRERVLEALRDAQDGIPRQSEHEKLTQSLARSALQADSAGDWQLLRDVSRLNIKTIDSFCAGLTRQMPVLSAFGGQAEPRDDAVPLYEEAVTDLYALLESDHSIVPDLRALLLHFDNNWERLQELLVSMLGRRDQWRMYVGMHETPDESESYLVATVEALVREELARLSGDLAPYHCELLALMQFSARNLGQPEPAKFPAGVAEDLSYWRNLRSLFLTAKGVWRKGVTKREGFPADKDEEAVKHKTLAQKVLADIRTLPDLAARLDGVRFLPQIERGSHSWELVLHLSRLLPLLAAQLLLVFRRHGAVDHGQVAQAALQALGDDDNPTELALRLDYCIEHLLVDEFQDTAITQYELLHKLTRGWGEHNEQSPQMPRTLMIVGDAMQSIYGFRSANVGLFLQARREGFNGVELEHLELQCNFRSDPALVEWVNRTFSQAFPRVEDVTSAQVSYTAAAAVKESTGGACVSLDGFRGDEARELEVTFICETIAQCLAKGERDIAVLGRQRSHLHPITHRLKQMGIPYQADSLDSLAHSPVVADLLNLCRALASDMDRLAWMALLRAPWCGLTLADLLTVAQFGEDARYLPLRLSIADPKLLSSLSEEGAQRLQHLRSAINQAVNSRDRLGLRVWVERLWVQLGGPRCAPDALLLEDAESFMQLLEVAESDGVGLDPEWLQRQVDKHFMSGGDPDSPVHVMTLHKAKGLEFDRVFIPRLNGLPRSDGGDLLLWDEHASERGIRSFLLAANDRSLPGAPTLYNYLREKRKEKSRLESTRLLYVGTTRAAKYLHLSAGVGWDEKNDRPKPPGSSSLLQTIWPTYEQQMTLHDAPEDAEAVVQGTLGKRVLKRLSLSQLPASVPGQESDASGENQPERAENFFERSVGTVIHLAMEELSLRETLPLACTAQDEVRWRQALQQAGLWGVALDDAMASVLESVQSTLAPDGEGRWVLSCDHLHTRSEWCLTTVTAQSTIEDMIIDRSFVDAETGCRWIIDYKSSRPEEGETWEAFVARQCELYTEQLLRYRAALRKLGPEPIYCALFFTVAGRLHTVSDLDLPASEA
jgi:ATP-dependent helicase/nuclease subunit A